MYWIGMNGSLNETKWKSYWYNQIIWPKKIKTKADLQHLPQDLRLGISCITATNLFQSYHTIYLPVLSLLKELNRHVVKVRLLGELLPHESQGSGWKVWPNSLNWSWLFGDSWRINLCNQAIGQVLLVVYEMGIPIHFSSFGSFAWPLQIFYQTITFCTLACCML